MKKILSILSAGLVLAGALLVTSCGEDTYEYYATTKLDSPSVTVKAYPGVNVITWKAVKDAVSYDVYETVGNNAETRIVSASTNLYATATTEESIVANASVTYKYRVVARASNQSSTNYTNNNSSFASSEKTVSVTTNKTVAANGTKFSALATKDYEAGNFSDKATALSDSAITVSSLVTDGYATVSFPVKSYAKYTVALNKVGSSTETTKSVNGALYKNNEIATIKINSLSSGKKTVTVTATPYYEGYEAEEFTATAKIEVAGLGVTNNASSGNATYTSVTSSAATARIYWQPATVDATGEAVPTTYYTVYRSSDADGTLTQVEGTVTAGGRLTSTSTYYYIDDAKITNTAVDYTYYIVVSNENKYGTAITADLDAYSLTTTSIITITPAPYKDDDTNVTNNLKITLDANDGQTISYVGIVALEEETSTYVASSFKELTLTNNDAYANSYIVYEKDLTVDTTYLIKAVIKEDGKKDRTQYTTATIAALAAGSFSVSASANRNADSGAVESVDVTVSDYFSTGATSTTDKVSNYTYTLYKVRTTTETLSTGATYVTVTSSAALKTLELAPTTTGSYSYSAKYADIDVGTASTATKYVTDSWYAVKTRKDDTTVSKKASTSSNSTDVTY